MQVDNLPHNGAEIDDANASGSSVGLKVDTRSGEG
jgi:hypothetical protein